MRGGARDPAAPRRPPGRPFPQGPLPQPGSAHAPTASAPRGGARPWPRAPPSSRSPFLARRRRPRPTSCSRHCFPASARWDPAFPAEWAGGALGSPRLSRQAAWPQFFSRGGRGAPLMGCEPGRVWICPRNGSRASFVVRGTSWKAHISCKSPLKTFAGGLSLALFLGPPKPCRARCRSGACYKNSVLSGWLCLASAFKSIR